MGFKLGQQVIDKIRGKMHESHYEQSNYDNNIDAFLADLNTPAILQEGKSETTLEDYTKTQKSIYDNNNIPSSTVVGQYKWHEQFPYETFLLYKYGDIRFPIFDAFQDKIAFDFACGPGRMVKRMNNIFLRCDGCDIAQRLLDEAKEINPKSEFYLTNGQNIGNVEENYYDFIFCTISMQHIASHTIRIKIIEEMKKALKIGGKITLQMAYNKDCPFVSEREYFLNDKKVILKNCINMADYLSDDTHADATNGAWDVGIGEKDLVDLKKDFCNIFGNVEIWFANVDNYYNDLKGESHINTYWAKDWIFIHCTKDN